MAIILCGLPIISEAIIGLITEFDIKADVLVSLALIASVCIGEYFAAGEVAFIMQIGGLLEELTVAKARAGIEKLVHLTPQTARVVLRGTQKMEQVIPAEAVLAGDILRVLPGETIPVDGVITEGDTSVNQSVMTGESMPVDKTVGDEVSSGTVNQFGTFEIVKAVVEKKQIIAGNEKMMNAFQIKMENQITEEAENYRSHGCTVIFIAVNGVLAGIAALTDQIREDSPKMITAIKNQEIEPLLLTGDHDKVAMQIAREAGISAVHADCLPETKLEWIGKYQDRGEAVAMIGDGVNDAPALKKANVGIALGGIGSDIAVDAADIALVNDDVRELPHLLALSKRMMKIIKLNLTFSMTLNFVAIVLAITGRLNPVAGALVHNCGSVLVIINSFLVLRYQSK